MRKKIVNILGMVLFCIGIFFLLYPIFNKYYSKVDIENIVKKFDQDIINMNQFKLQKLLSDAKEYNNEIFLNHQKNLTSELSYQKESINLSSYGIESDIFGYLQIDKIDVLLPIYLGASNENLSLGAVHLSETSLPIGGENVNTVLAAHRGMYGADALKNIDELAVGDIISIKNYWEVLNYQVTGYEVIDPNEVNSLYIVENEDRLTLFSCNPPKDTKRYVVYAKRII